MITVFAERASGFRPPRFKSHLGPCLLWLSLLALAGCGVAAAPCRVASAGLKMVPLVGHPAAAPTDTCAQAIDPG
jgi:hypothetical protein